MSQAPDPIYGPPSAPPSTPEREQQHPMGPVLPYGPSPDVLFIRSSADFYNLSRVFTYASGDIFNATQSFYSARAGGDPFGNGTADSNYNSSVTQVQQALQNLQNALDQYATRINDIGVAYEQTESGNAHTLGG